MDTITVVIIDEQPFYRAGVRQVLAEQPDFKILDCDATEDALGFVDAELPDVALLGSDLAHHSGLDLGRQIARYYPNTKVIMLSPNPDDEELFEVIKNAAVACLEKKTAAAELINIIRRVVRGEYPINESLMARPQVARHVLKQFQDVLSVGRGMEAVVAPLTRRETQILEHIASGKSNKQIAQVMEISEQTIKNHVSAILRKLNANDRAHAVALALRSGLILIDRES